MRVNDAFPFAPDAAPLIAFLWKARALLDAGLKRAREMMSQVAKFMNSRAYRVRSAYRRLFLTQTGEPNRDAATILTDLAKFCNAHRTTAIRSHGNTSFDPMAIGIAEGRRQMWLHLMGHLCVSDAAILRLHEQEMTYE